MLVVGKFLKTYGVKGQIKVESFLSKKKDIKNFKKFFLENKEPVKLNFLKEINEIFLCKINTINFTNEVKKYTGKLIFVEKQDLPKLEKDNFYFFQIEGLNVQVKDKKIGKVLTVNNHGAGDYIEIKTYNKKNSLLLVPYNKFHIKIINIKENYIELNKDYYSDEI